MSYANYASAPAKITNNDDDYDDRDADDDGDDEKVMHIISTC